VDDDKCDNNLGHGRTKDHNGYYINFNQDAFGSLLSVTGSLSNTPRTMTYAYGLKAFRTSMADMDLGSRSYTLHALGEITSYTDGKGQDFSATFDALSSMTNQIVGIFGSKFCDGRIG
jgi:hypothetical protein